jgi:transposase InsO family protein
MKRSDGPLPSSQVRILAGAQSRQPARRFPAPPLSHHGGCERASDLASASGRAYWRCELLANAAIAASRFVAVRRARDVAAVPCPTANPRQLTGARESVDSPFDGRSLQIDLVRIYRAVPATGRVGSRNPCPSASAQRVAAQKPEASSARQLRPAVACWDLSPGSRGAGRPEDYKAGDAAALAPCRLPRLLALEIPTARWPAKYTGGHSAPHSRDECRQPALGRPADPRRTTQARHRCWTDHGRKIYGEEEDAAVAGWKTFLRTHADGIASIDLFLVPTISFRLLHGLLILQHNRRKLLWLAVTAHPSAEWLAQQLTEAYGWHQAPRYIVGDRDCIYCGAFLRRLRAMGIRDRPTAPRSPWQNGYTERLIGSIRRDCLDHVVVFGERHLRHLLKSYQKYYNEARTHLSLQKDAPIPRAIQTVGQTTVAVPILGGLHHQYIRA